MSTENKVPQHLQFGGLAEIRAPKAIKAVDNLTASKILLTNGSKDVVSSTLAESDIVTASNTKTFTNKTFDANGTGNSISNLEVADFASGVVATDLDTTFSDDSKIASAKASKTYIDAEVAGAKSYADGLVVGLLDDRGNYDASGNAFPSSGGSGSAGAILKGDLWTISVAGTLGGHAVTAGDVVRALVDSPGSTASNWAITENNFGYVAENSANKSNNIASDTGSTTKYPTVNAVEVAIAAAISGAGSYATTYVDFQDTDFVSGTDDVLTIAQSDHDVTGEFACIFYELGTDGSNPIHTKLNVAEIIDHTGAIILSLPLGAKFSGRAALIPLTTAVSI